MNGMRADFPQLKTNVNGHPLVYLDSAASSLKPKQVLDAIYHFYANEYANVGRGVYFLAESATIQYEKARALVAQFIRTNANNVIFTRGATDGMNMLAHGWGMSQLQAGDEIIMPEWEHHSTLLPWQQVAKIKSVSIRFIPVLADGTLDESAVEKLISKKTKAIIIAHESNVFGTLIDLKKYSDFAKKQGMRLFVDAAQSAPHGLVDLSTISVDALVFSGHKMCGPTGIGVLYLNDSMMEQMPPVQFGGGMVYQASLENAQWRKGPHKFEAGTPAIAQAIGLGAAVTYLMDHVDFVQLRAHQAALCAQLIAGLQKITRARIHGPIAQLQKEGHLVSFELDQVPVHDAAAFLGARGICVRAGNLCAQPVAQKLKIQGLIRASFYIYSTTQDVESLLQAIKELLKIF